MNKTALATVISINSVLTQRSAEKIVDEIFDTITRRVAKGNDKK